MQESFGGLGTERPAELTGQVGGSGLERELLVDGQVSRCQVLVMGPLLLFGWRADRSWWAGWADGGDETRDARGELADHEVERLVCPVTDWVHDDQCA